MAKENLRQTLVWLFTASHFFQAWLSTGHVSTRLALPTPRTLGTADAGSGEFAHHAGPRVRGTHHDPQVQGHRHPGDRPPAPFERRRRTHAAFGHGGAAGRNGAIVGGRWIGYESVCPCLGAKGVGGENPEEHKLRLR